VVDGQGEMCDTVDQISHSTFPVHIHVTASICISPRTLPYVHHTNTNFLHRCSFWLRTQRILNFECAGEKYSVEAVMCDRRTSSRRNAEKGPAYIVSPWRYFQMEVLYCCLVHLLTAVQTHGDIRSSPVLVCYKTKA